MNLLLLGLLYITAVYGLKKYDFTVSFKAYTPDQGATYYGKSTGNLVISKFVDGELVFSDTPARGEVVFFSSNLNLNLEFLLNSLDLVCFQIIE